MGFKKETLRTAINTKDLVRTIKGLFLFFTIPPELLFGLLRIYNL